MINKEVPKRRCVGCMKSFPKENLNRYVNVNGVSVLDNEKKQSGRGFYVCKTSEKCMMIALRKGKIING